MFNISNGIQGVQRPNVGLVVPRQHVRNKHDDSNRWEEQLLASKSVNFVDDFTKERDLLGGAAVSQRCDIGSVQFDMRAVAVDSPVLSAIKCIRPRTELMRLLPR